MFNKKWITIFSNTTGTTYYEKLGSQKYDTAEHML